MDQDPALPAPAPPRSATVRSEPTAPRRGLTAGTEDDDDAKTEDHPLRHRRRSGDATIARRNPTLAETGGLPPAPPGRPGAARTLSASVCHAITRQSASNLALAFVLLPSPQRQAMSALYAFCREVDDVADEDQLPADVRRATPRRLARRHPRGLRRTRRLLFP